MGQVLEKESATLRQAEKITDLEEVEKVEVIDVQDHYGNTPLHNALQKCRSEGEELVTLLLEKGANAEIQDRNGDTPLMLAIRYHPECVFPIINSVSGKETVNIPNDLGDYPLHDAVLTGDTEVLRVLLDNGAFVDCKDWYGMTPLHRASSFKCSLLLIGRGAQVNVKDYRGCTALSWAVFNDGIDKVRLLLHVGAEVNSQDNDGRTPLHHLCKRSMVSERVLIADTLLDLGASLTIKDNSGRTPSDVCPEVADCGKRYMFRRSCVLLSVPT